MFGLYTPSSLLFDIPYLWEELHLMKQNWLIWHKTCPLNYLHIIVTIHNTLMCSQLKMHGFVSHFIDTLLAWFCVHIKRYVTLHAQFCFSAYEDT